MTVTELAEPEQSAGVEHVDVLIVGAGLSGICAAHYVQTDAALAREPQRDAVGQFVQAEQSSR